MNAAGMNAASVLADRRAARPAGEAPLLEDDEGTSSGRPG